MKFYVSTAGIFLTIGISLIAATDLTISSNVSRLIEGESARLSCRISPPLNQRSILKWFRDGREISRNCTQNRYREDLKLQCFGGKKLKRADLILKSAKTIDSGNWYCGFLNENSKRKSITVIEKLKSSLQSSKSNKPLSENDPLDLTCEVTGGEKTASSDINWFFKAMDTEHFRPLAIDGNEYSIAKLDYSHAGEYMCKAVQATQFTESSRVINFKISPRVKRMEPAVLKVGIGENADLLIAFYSNPKLIGVKCYHHVSMKTTNLEDNGMKNVYHFRKANVDVMDYGYYVCNATNGLKVSHFLFHMSPVFTVQHESVNLDGPILIDYRLADSNSNWTGVPEFQSRFFHNSSDKRYFFDHPLSKMRLVIRIKFNKQINTNLILRIGIASTCVGLVCLLISFTFVTVYWNRARNIGTNGMNTQVVPQMRNQQQSPALTVSAATASSSDYINNRSQNIAATTPRFSAFDPYDDIDDVSPRDLIEQTKDLGQSGSLSTSTKNVYLNMQLNQQKSSDNYENTYLGTHKHKDEADTYIRPDVGVNTSATCDRSKGKTRQLERNHASLAAECARSTYTRLGKKKVLRNEEVLGPLYDNVESC